MGEKICPRCRLPKPRSAFRAMPKRSNGISSYCIQCEAEYKAQYAGRLADFYREIPDDFDRDGFWALVEKTADCWIWKGSLSRGYGRFNYRNTRPTAHLVAFILSGRTVPDGLHLDHLCRNRACVRPDHLDPVTCRENLHRGAGPNPINAAKTHCPKRHAYTPENTRIDKNDKRHCRTCERERYGRSAA